jgi:hypothetical protein
MRRHKLPPRRESERDYLLSLFRYLFPMLPLAMLPLYLPFSSLFLLYQEAQVRQVKTYARLLRGEGGVRRSLSLSFLFLSSLSKYLSVLSLRAHTA